MDKQSTDWAILVYISADRVLTNFAVESLKQLKRSAGKGIVALAQMQATGEADTRRYVFDSATDPNSSIEDDLQPSIRPAPSPGGIANPQNLVEFVKWASQYEARHRCLFLWGHGYELLLNEDGRSSSGGSREGRNRTNAVVPAAKPQDGQNDSGAIGRNYLAPRSLKTALETAKPFVGQLDIIGIDACSLCLVELASELGDCGDYLVASQEDVPDASFPYDQFLLKLKNHDRNDVEGICAAIPQLYAQAYQDYVVAPETGMKEITLSSLRLKNTASITEPLGRLAASLLSSASDPATRKKILAARKAARDFALGLFVDLSDFCLQLKARLGDSELSSECDAVRQAMESRDELGCVLANETGEGARSRCHGLSIYFPYLTQAEMEQTRQSLTGTTSTLDQAPLMLKGGTNHILKARSVQVTQIEGDFESLPEFKKTNWQVFIKHGWSVILASEEPNELDAHYSGEQCAINLLSLLKTYAQSDPEMAAVAAKA